MMRLESILYFYKKETSLKDYVPFISDYIRSKASSEFVIKNNFDRYPNMQKNYQKVCQELTWFYNNFSNYFITNP